MQGLFLDELEILSLKILAVQMYTDDLKGLSCIDCPLSVQEDRNCSMQDIEKDVWYNDRLDIHINTCPLNCIIPEHYSFADRYIYYTQTTAQMPSYDQCDARFWGMYRLFTSYKNILTARG